MNIVVGELVTRSARKFAKKEAVVFAEHRWNWQQIEEMSNACAHALLDFGMKKGDKIALLMRNCDEFIIAYFGIIKMGGVAVPVNYKLAPPEIEYILNHSDSRMLFLEAEYLDAISQIENRITGIEKKILARGKQEEYPVLWDLIKSFPVDAPQIEISPDDDADIIYTSGTTGKPKGALFTHQALIEVANLINIVMTMDEPDRILEVMPFFHSAPLHLLLLGGTYVSATHLVLSEFDPVAMLQMIQDEKATQFFGAPVVFSTLAPTPLLQQFDISSMRVWAYGGAPMPGEAVKKAMAAFGGEFCCLYGLTEAGPGGCVLKPAYHDWKAGSCGNQGHVNCEMRLINAEGNDVGTDEVGEIILKSPGIMKEYYQNPEATAATLRDGWIYTGDLATRDADGFYWIIDRKKDMIISGGENIYPKEVEDVLSLHPDIIEAAVIGIGDEKWGEIPLAVLHAAREISLEELTEFCSQHLAKYKIPKRIEYVDVLPRTATGKVLKTELRRMWS
ncbi:MAG: hypothetical protein DRH04_03960 [Deltaproteobacteria bacterium]|nr:MAG: hypothetical protein DRH04_03960 [Deltaproteobacteria bacterium]